MKSSCNESCRSSNRELRSIEFEFFRFYTNLYQFTSLLFLKTKEKENEILHLGPWNDLRACKYAPGRTLEQGRRRVAGIRRLWSPAARAQWGGGTRRARGT